MPGTRIARSVGMRDTEFEHICGDRAKRYGWAPPHPTTAGVTSVRCEVDGWRAFRCQYIGPGALWHVSRNHYGVTPAEALQRLWVALGRAL